MNDELNISHLQTAKLLKKVRYITVSHLPIKNSFITYDLLIHLIENDLSGNLLTVKRLFAELPYSDMGTRFHFKRLVDEEWIELIENKEDARSKYCKASEKLKSKFQTITSLLVD